MSWLQWRRREPWVEDYRALSRRRPPRKSEVADYPVLVLDAETSGFNPATDHLLSLASIEVRGRDIAVNSARQWLIYQEDAEINEAVHVHGIMPSQTAAGKPEREVMREFLPLLAGHLVVGHHVGFDGAMLSSAARRHFGLRLKNPVVDTAVLAMRELIAFRKSGYPNQRPPSLDEVCSQLGIEMMDRHTASGDAFTTAEVFLLLCARLRRRLKRPVQFRDLPMGRL